MAAAVQYRVPRSAGARSKWILSTAPSRPKRKRSYSVDADLCSALELVSWWHRRSASSVVEDLVREYLRQHATELDEARSIAIAKARVSAGKAAAVPSPPPRS